MLGVALPMVKPTRVTIKLVDALTLPFCTVSSIKLAVCNVQFSVTLVFVNTTGAGVAKKKFSGCRNVIVPSSGMAPPALGANINVTEMPVLLRWRSTTEMLNNSNVTRSPMYPLEILSVFGE
jgi:hypothetical protein